MCFKYIISVKIILKKRINDNDLSIRHFTLIHSDILFLLDINDYEKIDFK